ncbi:unnamed protein product, partial [Mycena citricolor]
TLPSTKMSVSLTPSHSLGFNRPLTQTVKRSLTLTNHNQLPLAFKVKTTAPKLYTVRPNTGRVEPGESVDVAVMLQPLKEEPPLNAKCKDKFLIQSTTISSDKDSLSVQDIWSSADPSNEGVHQQKLRVVYLPAEGQTLVEEDEEVHANPSSMIAPGGDTHFATVRQHNPPVNGEVATEIERPSSPPGDFSNANEVPHDEHPSFEAPGVIVTPPPADPITLKPEQEIKSAPEPEPTPVPPPVAKPAASTPTPPVVRTASIPTPVVERQPPAEDYALKWTQAQAEIERLRAMLAAPAPAPVTEMRRRTRRVSDTSAGTTAVDFAPQETTIQEGVPLQVVVIIALGVFITTYLFF